MGEARRVMVLPANEPWEPWKTIELGNYPSNLLLFDAVQKSGVRVDVWTRDIVTKLKIQSPGSITLYRVTLKKLGLKFSADYDEVRTQAALMGFKLVPTEVVAQLRLQYLDQPLNEELIVGSKTFPFQGFHRGYIVLAHDHLGKRFVIREPLDAKGIKKTAEIILCR